MEKSYFKNGRGTTIKNILNYKPKRKYGRPIGCPAGRWKYQKTIIEDGMANNGIINKDNDNQ